MPRPALPEGIDLGALWIGIGLVIAAGLACLVIDFAGRPGSGAKAATVLMPLSVLAGLVVLVARGNPVLQKYSPRTFVETRAPSVSYGAQVQPDLFVTTVVLNVRRAPSINSEVVRRLAVGQPVLARRPGKDTAHWAWVETLDGRPLGYVATRYLKEPPDPTIARRHLAEMFRRNLTAVFSLLGLVSAGLTITGVILARFSANAADKAELVGTVLFASSMAFGLQPWRGMPSPQSLGLEMIVGMAIEFPTGWAISRAATRVLDRTRRA